eukprot:gnl/Chilomastix_cuspidata/110.p1 GENE.gnl/Chilomastix_cuspidata/110~~gnl/Chilomastix_cuspidata/110.p1  ORF type:complete len:698 (+),score=324.49 gnl/Chilomastix_cuspidata/110:48-2096(+)
MSSEEATSESSSSDYEETSQGMQEIPLIGALTLTPEEPRQVFMFMPGQTMSVASVSLGKTNASEERHVVTLNFHWDDEKEDFESETVIARLVPGRCETASPEAAISSFNRRVEFCLHALPGTELTKLGPVDIFYEHTMPLGLLSAFAGGEEEEEEEEEEDAEFFPMAREPAYMRGARRGGAGGSSSDDGHYVQAVQENSIEDVLFRMRCIIRRPSFLPVVTDPQACPHFARLQQDVAHDPLVPPDALMAAIFRAALPPPAIRYINKGRICALRERMKVREQLRQLEAEASAEPTSETDEFEAPPDAPPSAEEVQRRLHRQKLAERQRERLAVAMDAASDPSKYYRTSLDWERTLRVLKFCHLFVKHDAEDLAAMRLWMLPLNFYGGNPRLTTLYSAIVGLQSSFFLVGDRSIRMRKAPERHPLMRAPSYYLHRRNRHASDRFFVGHSFDIKWVRRIRVAPNSMRVRIEFHDALPLVVFTYDPDCCSELVTYVQYALELEYHRRDLSLTKACFDVVNDRDLYFERIRRDILAPRPLRPPAASGLSQKLLAEEAVVSYAIVRERRRLPSDMRHGLGAIPIYSLVVTSHRLFLLEEDFTLWPPSAQSAASTTRAPFRVHKEARAASVAELTLSQAHAEVFQIRFRGAAAPWLLFCNDWKHRAVVVRLLRAALPGAELGLDDGQIN